VRPVAPQPFGLGEPAPMTRCRHCRRPYSEHTAEPGRMVPRTECFGMRGRFEPEVTR